MELPLKNFFPHPNTSSPHPFQFTQSIIKEIEKRRINIFSLTLEQLVHKAVNPKAIRNTVGIDSSHVFHLRKGRLLQEKSEGLIVPSSNMAHLSLQSGGGVFSVTGVRGEKKVSYYMKLFRQLLLNAFLEASKKFFSKEVY